MNLVELKNVHFVGIGGIGMSGLAEVLAHGGVAVSGCDLKRSSATDLLERRGVRVMLGHDPAHLDGVEAVVVTAAVRGGHPEIDAARARAIPVVRRAELLGQIVAARRAVGVAGTHGKTTTSAMVSMVLAGAGLEPTILVGGILRDLGTNAKVGSGDLLVVEADEYDRTFHHLHPELAVVTNIEADHLEYYGSLDAIREAFRIYLEGVKPGGAIVACVDDPNVASIVSADSVLDLSTGVTVIRYGLSAAADLRAVDLRHTGSGVEFTVPGFGSFSLLIPGEHNVRNALAAIGIARQLQIPHSVVSTALAEFKGVDRRFQVIGDCNGALVVDDYAHHPTEIRATLKAAREGYPQRRIVALFQPHLYSRTRDFAREFAEALRIADVPLVAPVFAAREAPIEGVSSELIAAEGVELVGGSNEEIAKQLRLRLTAGDVFITMGAGDVNEIAERLIAGEGA